MKLKSIITLIIMQTVLFVLSIWYINNLFYTAFMIFLECFFVVLWVNVVIRKLEKERGLTDFD